MHAKRTPGPAITKHTVGGIDYARVRLSVGGTRRDYRLGRWGSREVAAEYRRLVAEFDASGRAVLPPRTRGRTEPEAITVRELCKRYWREQKGRNLSRHYLRGDLKPALRRLRDLYGHTPAAAFGPGALRAFRAALIAERIRHETRDEKGNVVAVRETRLSRGYVNKQVLRVRQVFAWGVSHELVPASVIVGLQSVRALSAGDTDAPSPERVRPVADELVNRTLPILPEPVADMVRLQRWTGMRPGELVSMTWGEIDASGDVWVYAPREHKNAGKEKPRDIFIGPKGQRVLMKYRDRAPDEPVFTPRQVRWSRRDRWTAATYYSAIARRCERQGLERWHPNQLRHAAATEARERFGVEAASAMLGHSNLRTTEVYAEKSRKLSLEAAKAVG